MRPQVTVHLPSAHEFTRDMGSQMLFEPWRSVLISLEKVESVKRRCRGEGRKLRERGIDVATLGHTVEIVTSNLFINAEGNLCIAVKDTPPNTRYHSDSQEDDIFRVIMNRNHLGDGDLRRPLVLALRADLTRDIQNRGISSPPSTNYSRT